MSVCRVCIQTDRDGDPVAVDVALPSGAPIGELLPAIVDMVDGRGAPRAVACRWRLDRPSGIALEESLSLLDNDVHDGELLILSQGPVSPLGPLRVEACQVAVAVQPASGVGHVLPAALCVTAVVLASGALAWTAGTGHAMTNLAIAAVSTCAAAAVAMLTRYGTAATVAVVALACATGFLAVPSAPAAPNAFLAAVVAACAALSMLRMSGRVSPTLTAAMAFSALTAVATGVAMPVVMTGAVLSIGALVLLALAPRIAVAVAALGPEHWNGQLQGRATVGHATLTGLVVGSAAGTASGAVIVTVAPVDGSPAASYGTIALAATTAIALLLRARTYADPARQISLVAAGVVSTVACLRVVFADYQSYVGSACAVLVVVGLVVLREPRISAALSRQLDRFECVVLAAVAPVACWACGVYESVGGFHP